MSKLENIINYDKDIYLSVNDINNQFVLARDLHSRFNTRAFLTLFNIRPEAQSHPAGKKGRGTHLYNRLEVLQALDFYCSYFERNSYGSSS